MDERRRFQIALGGIATCLLIAALFVSSAPPLSYPVVPRAALGAPMPLACELPPPGLPEPPALAPPPRARRLYRPVLPNRSVARLVTRREATPSPPPGIEPEPLQLRQPGIALTSPPGTRAVSVAIPEDSADSPEERDGHGPVAGAFLAAGKEVGRGFRTAGRAIKSVF